MSHITNYGTAPVMMRGILMIPPYIHKSAPSEDNSIMTQLNLSVLETRNT